MPTYENRPGWGKTGERMKSDIEALRQALAKRNDANASLFDWLDVVNPDRIARLLDALDVRVPLTDERVLDIAGDFKSQHMHGGTMFDEFDALGFARAIEAALKDRP